MTTIFLERPGETERGPQLWSQVAQERPQDGPAVDALVGRAFGPGRFAKSAERLREGATLHRELSVCAWRGSALVGAVRLWRAEVGATPVAFLGPIAVDRAARGRGLGAALVNEARRRAIAEGESLILLVGDLGFFGPLGFDVAPPGRVVLPGPVDPARVLWSALRPGACDGVCGPLRGRPPA